jgi:hypothetical protein
MKLVGKEGHNWNDAEVAHGATIAAEMNSADAANASAKSHTIVCGDRWSISEDAED